MLHLGLFVLEGLLKSKVLDLGRAFVAAFLESGVGLGKLDCVLGAVGAHAAAALSAVGTSLLLFRHFFELISTQLATFSLLKLYEFRFKILRK